MIQEDALTRLITDVWPDAKVAVLDKTGQADHFIIRVVTPHFEQVALLDRHRQVMACLKPAFEDGRLHAAEIQTATA